MADGWISGLLRCYFLVHTSFRPAEHCEYHRDMNFMQGGRWVGWTGGMDGRGGGCWLKQFKLAV